MSKDISDLLILGYALFCIVVKIYCSSIKIAGLDRRHSKNVNQNDDEEMTTV